MVALPKFPRIRLRVGIAVMFLLVMLPLTGGMVGALYRQNSTLAYDMAEAAMDRATRDIVDNVSSMLGPIARTVDMTVAFGKAEREGLRRPESMRPLLEALEQLPNLYSLYYGLERDGAFFQVVRLNSAMQNFGPNGNRPPAEARYALRLLDDSSGEMKDSYFYLAKWGDVVGVERGPVHYDPRQRPWYEAALKGPGVATSGVYIFSGTGRPGLTLSRQMTSDDGERLGTVGADLSIEALSTFLDERRIGKSGQVFILDEEGRLIGYPKPEMVVVQEGDKVTVVKGEAVADPVVAEAVRKYHAGAGSRFKAEMGGQGEVYMVSFTPFPESFGKNWTIGAIAAESDFVGPLRRASLIILLIGCGFIILATIAVVVLSRLLTRPIHALIAETDRIRDFNLEGEIHIRSGVTEIDALAQAVGAMKTALRSFSAYVPKVLVRNIIASGVGTEIGGERRPLSVLFTVIRSVAETTESMVPEDVLAHLSEYLEAMSRTIHGHGGTVDKFMGDAVMALWNAPSLGFDHVAHACHAMLACRSVSVALDAGFSERGYSPFPTRFGLHTGTAVVGNVGSSDRMQYTALGAMVNLASRVEGLNKRYGTQLLVTGAVEEAVRDKFLFRPVEVVVPYGMTVPVPLFELVADLRPGATFAPGPGDIQRYLLWGEGFALYQGQDWSRAVEVFTQYLNAYPGDGAAELLLGRSIEYQTTPPPEGWDGTMRFMRK